MARIRWYHFYFLLALFDVIVILISLDSHRRTLDGVSVLISSAERLDRESRWLQRAQQALLELNDPGNDLFHSHDYARESRRFQLAKEQMLEILDAAKTTGLNVTRVAECISFLNTAAEDLFKEFAELDDDQLTAPEREARLARAGSAMARMDDQHQAALRAVGLLAIPNAGARDELLHLHERDIQDRLRQERYFIAAVVLILVGILLFGRKLQQTDRALAEERRRVQEERRERLAAIGELCSSVAHGIRNPLAAMRSSAELTLELGEIDAESRERVQDIVNEGQRLADRVTRLLNFARVRSDGTEPIDLGGLVAETTTELAPELARRGIRVDASALRTNVQVVGDRQALQQAVIELISNAMEQSPAGGEIRVSCAGANGDGMASFGVEDDGPGVPFEARARIFELFYTTRVNGTGIGLATVRRIARQHGGDVRVGDGPHGGARFTVTIPAAPGGASSAGKGADPNLPGR